MAYYFPEVFPAVAVRKCPDGNCPANLRKGVCPVSYYYPVVDPVVGSVGFRATDCCPAGGPAGYFAAAGCSAG